ncbi:MAG: GatB/YqeY domain-containing protein [Candidatus Eisenbacteria bacterium]|uniref:GatB/YqeY domain-containing protein n=1 Tax=Eiseniibacteriota bacterium TaxID=2212470 RepID=A0A538UCK1_UNCEI|nr:MAG: GatB/YqeY domain-containing protein [Candidatus Eisenbacteria bacterium]
MTDPDILQRIQTDMTAAMKAKDAATLSTLRMLKTALMEAKTKKPKDEGLSADEAIDVIQRYARKRRESIEEFKKLGREDLVASEEQEIQVTARYLPQGLSEDEVRVLVREAVAATGAAGPKDMGKVIGAVMAKARGKVEGGTVSRLAKDLLGG